jgi:hypothetical protein
VATSDLTVALARVLGLGKLVLNPLAELRGKERGYEVIPYFQSHVICCLASYILLLNICVASAKEMEKTGAVKHVGK